MPKLTIKTKYKNDYLLTPSGNWARDFNKSAYPVDINNFIDPKEYKLFVDHEMRIQSMQIPSLGNEFFKQIKKCVIVSDGFDFDKKQDILKDIPDDIGIIGTNRSLVKWTTDRRMDYYLVNNPYNECLSYLPAHKYRPRCLVSSRTNPDFVKRYKGDVVYYLPVSSDKFGKNSMTSDFLDDYRNPVCAAIGFAYRLGVEQLILFCCDNSFSEMRPLAEQIENGLWIYPQHRIGHELIDASLYWFKQRPDTEIKVANCSSGPNCENAEYIDVEDLPKFFNEP